MKWFRTDKVAFFCGIICLLGASFTLGLRLFTGTTYIGNYETGLGVMELFMGTLFIYGHMKDKKVSKTRHEEQSDREDDGKRT